MLGRPGRVVVSVVGVKWPFGCLAPPFHIWGAHRDQRRDRTPDAWTNTSIARVWITTRATADIQDSVPRVRRTDSGQGCPTVNIEDPSLRVRRRDSRLDCDKRCAGTTCRPAFLRGRHSRLDSLTSRPRLLGDGGLGATSRNGDPDQLSTQPRDLADGRGYGGRAPASPFFSNFHGTASVVGASSRDGLERATTGSSACRDRARPSAVFASAGCRSPSGAG